MLFGYTWALMHHMLGGIRHLIWDNIIGLEPGRARMAGDGQPFGSIALTIVIWVVVYMFTGGLRSMSMRTPLGRVRGLGSAKSGTEHFWRQRVTAVANVPLTIAGVIIVVSLLGRNQRGVRRFSARR